MFPSLLIANRGEIACRIMRTAKRLGLRTIAVHSEADAGAMHVRLADEAHCIGPAAPTASYLDGAAILRAAQASGAAAIHPGYGFLSENAEFAQSVIDAGLIWVGPDPASIRAMGLKDAATALMQAAGVPVTPGYMGENQDAAFLAERAAETGWPVLIKAVAGGGGKGMRLVERAEDFAEALASCQREAASSFGNPAVLIEKYITAPRHIEVQVFGDAHGNAVHLFERDCSLQRRHQKVIEEAPAPGMDEATRAALCATAVRAAQAVRYRGAGTIEFIADGSEGLRADRIWFMEMNTRLQVEHPVTEAITGIDLVEWQLRVAAGEPLPLGQDAITMSVHAAEARVYAEDPAKGFLPSTGRLEHLMLPEHLIRVETGVFEGGEVSAFYDPMIAKLVCHATDRDGAIGKLANAASVTAIWPVRTNAAFLLKCLVNERFKSGDVETNFIADAGDALIPSIAVPDAVLHAGAMAVACQSVGNDVLQLGTSLRGRWRAETEPWSGAFGFRLNAGRNCTIRVNVDSQCLSAEIPDPYAELPAWVEPCGNMILSGINDGRVFAITAARTDGSPHGPAATGTILSPMPGKIIAVEVTQGQHVTKGQRLFTLEAMKMEHSLTAPFDGIVAELSATPGAQVQVEALLARIEPAGA